MLRTTSTRRLTEAALAVRQAALEVGDERLRRRLRRAERLLREEMGGSVPKSVAAHMLGVSTTALARWVEAGKLPVVRRPAGRTEIAAEALLEVAGEVARLRDEGKTRGVLAAAFRSLEERGLPTRRPRPNMSARELRAAHVSTTPLARLEEAAALSEFATTLAALAAESRGTQRV